MSARGFLARRWPWVLAAAVAAALVWLPLSIRARGRAHYAEARARLEAAGMGGGPEALKREAPPTDPSLQARWRRIVERAVNSGLQRSPQTRWKVAEWLNGGGPEPEGARAVYEADADLREEAAAFLEEGIPVAGGLGNWLAAGGGPVNPLGGIRCENLLGVKNLVNVLLVQAAFESDPGPALAALDRVHAAFEHTGTITDAMIGNAVGDARDETYARLAAARRLPRAAAERWLAEEPVEPRRTARALRGERVLFLEPLAEGLFAGTLSGSAFGWNSGGPSGPVQWLRGRGEASGWWLHGAEACARVLDHYGAAEAALREGRPLPAFPEAPDAAGRLAGVMCANIHAVATTAFMARQRHRAARAFVRALEAPLEGVLPPGGPGELPLLVQRAEGDRLRVVSDQDGPLPPAWQGVPLPVPAPDTSVPRRAFVWRYGLIEADWPSLPR